MRKPVVTALFLALLATPIVSAGEFYQKYKKDERKLGQPTEDRALVYVIRAAKMGAAIRTWAFYDDALIGVSRASGYSFALVPPGERVFWSKAENTSAITVDVEAGQTYYFKQKILPGIGKARVKLVQIGEAEGTKLLKKCGYVEATPAGRERAAEIARNRLERAERKAAKKQSKSGGESR